MILAAQIRAARGLLGLSQTKLSELANVGIATVKRIELTVEISGSARTLWKLQTALEDAGVEFIPEDDLKGPGVRLKESTRSRLQRKRKSSG
jgi:transcriptional regulator with XRE-family HTH domain